MVIVTISAGNIEYGIQDAAIPIQDMIELLESAQSEGATHIAGTSGNYRGAQYVRLGRMYDFADEED